MSYLLSSLLKKNKHERISFATLFKRADVSNLLLREQFNLISSFLSKIEWFARKNSSCLSLFDSFSLFSPFYAQERIPPFYYSLIMGLLLLQMEFMLSFLNIIDLLGILPFYFSFVLTIISSEYSIGRTRYTENLKRTRLPK